jgi:thiol-disulfide isomerase/thioredoxin
MRRALLLLVMIAGVALVVWSGWHNWHARRLATQAQQAQVQLIADTPDPSDPALSPLRGKPAPAFTLDNIDGSKVSLSDFKGHPLLLNYWGTYCGPCKLEMPWIQEFSQKYAADGFKVVGVTYDSEVGKDFIAKSAHKLGVTYPIVLSDRKMEDTYLQSNGILPMSFYIDRAGKIIEVTAGAGDKDKLEAMVKEVIAAEDK